MRETLFYNIALFFFHEFSLAQGGRKQQNMLRRATAFQAAPLCFAGVVAHALTSSSSPSVQNSCISSSALTVQQRFVHGKPATSHKKRTQHTRQWWNQAKARHLTARPHDESPIKPHFPAYSEDVDAPMIVPRDAACFNCKKRVDTEKGVSHYVWIPSGNARYPTPQGYVFHMDCFKCWSCKTRMHHNKFFSKNDRAWCLDCAVGREKGVPTRRWHSPFVNGDRTSSRVSGAFFPRHKHQIEFLFNPEE